MSKLTDDKRLKRRKMIQDEYVKLPFCKVTTCVVQLNGTCFSVYCVQGKDGLFVLHHKTPEELRKRCPLAVRAIFAGVNWRESGPVVLDLLQLPDSEVWILFDQIHDDYDYRENRPF